jgi:hypothetical protein
MSDAPETLWVWVLSKSQSSFLAYKDKPGELGKPTEYTRTDISQARIAALEAALDEIQGLCPTSPQDNPTPQLGGFYGSQLQTVGNLTREALKEKP